LKPLLSPSQLHDYQKECVLHGLFNDDAMFWLQMGLGKEQPISEPVLTMDGWIPIGEISPGDYVIGSDGTPTEVHRVYPQGVKEVVKVTFSDGTYTRCGWDHLWAVYSEHQRFKGLSHTVKSLRDLVDGGLTKKNGKNDDMFKWSIPIVEPVNYFNPQQLKIDPYTLGVILGDGHVSEKSGVIVCTDTSILEAIGASAIKPHNTSEYTSYGYIKGIKQIIRDLGLMGKRSWEKFVPSEYLLASVDQRLALLQGLLDTDGSPIDKGGVEFSSTSENLIDAVINITQSLGGIARSKLSRVTKYQGGEGRESWRVNVKLPSQFTPFRCERKLSRWVRPTKYQPMRKIVGVEVVGVEESVCISVAASDSLYVTRNFIITHNTPISLTILIDRMKAGQVKKCLIFGPLRVIQSVWTRECRKWEHTKHLRCSVLHGVKEKRTRALFADADIFLCNYENMNWLAETLDHYYTSQGKELPFEMVIYDEVSKLKNSTTKRMGGGKRDRTDRWGTTHTVKVIGWRKMIDKFKYRIGLTGTPASNGYLDLHGQYLAVDGGKRLGEYITHYKDSYFVSDYMGWGHTPTEEGKQWIEHHIADITKKMDAKDYLDMPAVTVTNVMVELPAAARKAYAEVEKNLFTTLDSGNEIEIFSKSSISNKCLQFCNGNVYLNSGSLEFDALHDAKLDALDDIIEEAAGRPVLCSYTFKSDAERIMKRFKSLHPVNLTATPSSKTESVVNDWNAGKIKLMVGHPASMGHGIDGLQDSGSIMVWFGLNWSLELYDQMNGRLDRQGQKNPVSIIRILCADTVDLAVADAIERKTDDQEGLKSALDRYRKGITTNDLAVNFF